jgi:hypothetical protein
MSGDFDFSGSGDMEREVLHRFLDESHSFRNIIAEEFFETCVLVPDLKFTEPSGNQARIVFQAEAQMQQQQ